MIFFLFFLSGVSALIYQVAWMKILTVEFGSTVYAVSTVLSVFMCGLALGSYLFGRWVDRTSRPLLTYATMEAILGVYAVVFLLSIPLVHEIYFAIERAFHPSFESFSLIKFAFTFILLLLPTTLMGGTLPVLSRYLGLDGRARARRLALLYSFNTLGAVVGSVGFAFFWILALGVKGSILLSVGINLFLALATLGLHHLRGPFARRAAGADNSEEPLAVSTVEPRGIPLRRLAIVVAFASGFVILACEVLWTRLFINFLTGNALIFATILTAVLTGLAAGGFIASYCVERVRNIAALLGAVQLTGAAFLALLVVRQSWVGEAFSLAYQSESQFAPFATLFFIVFVPCAVLGITFPALIKWMSRGASTIGSDIGKLYAVNTAGAVLGSLVSGFVLIRALGVNGSLLALSVLYGVVAVLLFTGRIARLAAAAAVLLCVVLLLIPSVREPRYWYNGGFRQVMAIAEENTEFLEEGVSATVGVAKHEADRYLTVNGIIVAQALPHDLWDLVTKAHLPMLIHPDPANVALVGLGAGISLGATEAYDLDRLDCIEISPEVVRASAHFTEFNGNGLADPRLNLLINDGRHYLMTTPHRYDVINVDPIDPPICTLYSQDFFQICHDRLRDGGLMVQWLPLFRLSPDNIEVVLQGFLNVFEHTTVWYNGTAAILIGSKGQPMKIDLQRFLTRASDPRVQESLKMIDAPHPWMLLSMYVGDGSDFREAYPGPIPENTDNRPYLEYTVLRSGDSADELSALQMLTKFSTPIEDHLDPAGLVPGYGTQLDRMSRINSGFFQARLHMFVGQQERAEALLRKTITEQRISEEELMGLRHFFAMEGE